MRFRGGKFLGAGLAAFVAGAGAANAGDGFCAGFIPGEASGKFRLARVAANGPRVNFLANAGDKNNQCPSANSACRKNTFVVPGDEVVVTRTEGPYACASYRSPRGSATDGWLPLAALDLAPVPPSPKPSDWAGKWMRFEASLQLKPKGAEIEVNGDATWGAGDPERVRRGGVNIGEISGRARPRGNVLAVGDGYDGVKPPGERKDIADCVARLQIFGRYLVVEDNGACGGNNVSFTGVYVRQAK